MAQALSSLSSSFDDWILSLLSELQSSDVDMSDFVQYLMGIVTSDSETDEEKQIAIAELLNDLDLKHQHNIDNLSSQILDQWHRSQNGICANGETHLDGNSTAVSRVADKKDDDAINRALINAMNSIESTSKQNKSGAYGKTDDDAALKRHRSQVLAKYSEVSDEELDYGDNQAGASTGNASGYSDTAGGIFRNTNAQDVEDRERKVRDTQQETHKKQQEKNKLDANNQKQKDEERKKKAQQRAQKQERRR